MGKSFLLAYHMERHARLKPTRKPIGLTFCPINFSGLVRCGHLFGMFTGGIGMAGAIGLLGLEFNGGGVRVDEGGSRAFVLIGLGLDDLGRGLAASGLGLLLALGLDDLFDRLGLDEGDLDVSGTLVDAGAAATGAGVHALHRRAFAGDGLLDDETLGAEIVVVLGVGDG